MAESMVLIGYDSSKSELGKMYVEAKDNVRFLMTLERHFKNITAGESYRILLIELVL